jgi:hypothetical protein
MRKLFSYIPCLIGPLAILATGCGAEGTDEEGSGGGAISTYYDTTWRIIYASAADIRYTPRVKITAKRLGSTCESFDYAMELVPQKEVTWSVCGQFGGESITVAGGASVCRSSVTKSPMNFYRYNFTSPTLTQLNYRVYDWNGRYEAATSGWLPPGSAANGCRRSF